MEITGKVTTETFYELNLRLSWKEAAVLLAVCDSICGSPDGPRGVTDSISEQLEALGVHADSLSAIDSGNIYLSSHWPTK